MSVRLSSLAPGPATAAVVTETHLVVGFNNGEIRVYHRQDCVLERSLRVGRGAVTQQLHLPSTQLVAVVCDSKCTVHNLATRKTQMEVESRSARFLAAAETSLGGPRLVVGSSYKIRIVDPTTGKTVVTDSPGGQRVRSLCTEVSGSVIVAIGSKVPRLWRLNVDTSQLRPVMVLPEGFATAHKFVICALPSHLFIGSSVSSALVRIVPQSPIQIVRKWDKQPSVAAAMVRSANTDIALLVSQLGNSLALINPETGNTLSTLPSAARPLASQTEETPALVDADNQVQELQCTLTVEQIIDLDGTEAASLAFNLPRELKASHDQLAQLREVQRSEAARLFDSDEIDESMRLYTLIEEQETSLYNMNHVIEVVKSALDSKIPVPSSRPPSIAPSNHSVTPSTSSVTPSIAPTFAPSGSQSVAPSGVPLMAFTPSMRSGRTSATRWRQMHPLDSVVAYLQFARRKLRLNPSKTEETAAASKGLDTLLFLCYHRMQSGLIVMFLRSINACDASVVTSVLLESGKWRELVYFYRSRGMHREALELLQEHNESAEAIAAYLEQAQGETLALDLALEFSKPLLKHKPELAHRLFFEDRSADTWKLYSFLVSEINQDIADEFARFRVLQLRDTSPELHDALALQLANAASGNPSPENDDKFTEFLASSEHIRPELLVTNPEIPARGRALLRERLQEYGLAIDMYVDEVSDISAAQKCAEKHAQATYLFNKLVSNTETYNSSLFTLLNSASTGSDLDLSHVLKTMPSTTSIKNVAPFLTNFVAAQSSKLRAAAAREAIARVALAEYSLELHDVRAKKYTVTPSDACAICHKRLGRAVSTVTNEGMAHYACIFRS